jgi:polyisoprenoid-binding protein YceI
MQPLRLGVLVLALAALTGCSSVQRAVISPMIADLKAAKANAPPVAVANGTTATSPVAAAASELPASSRFVFRPGTSQLTVVSGDVFGNYPSQVTRYRGRLTLLPNGAQRIAITFDMTSLRAQSADVTACLQYDFLEIDKHPEAHFEATLQPTTGTAALPEEVMVDGNLELHGQHRRVTFKGKLHPEADGYRFTSTFDLDRHAFDIRRRDVWDWMARDDFRVTMNMRGTPEKVRAEEVSVP